MVMPQVYTPFIIELLWLKISYIKDSLPNYVATVTRPNSLVKCEFVITWISDWKQPNDCLKSPRLRVSTIWVSNKNMSLMHLRFLICVYYSGNLDEMIWNITLLITGIFPHWEHKKSKKYLLTNNELYNVLWLLEEQENWKSYVTYFKSIFTFF